ncbi:Transcriptional activator of proteases prtT [Penicillium chermesinum]|uniref:Transcriptional activator of proteases prtT n=1 Tax=Penicillium chermesinum TaxID=63820 RepID=A0A9W9NDK3_9EURO|nr:Transcriptional activator of proteases prtT [Penicillium chermesinum]KAJ5216984.1 Transcriptional activator of proteases prtT [Penicillium chermesinum]
MTRTEPTQHSSSWETKSITATDDGTVGQDARPRGRIRRSMTACNTCRKLKTRCDLDPRGHACRRCLSLRLECELPETPDRYQDTTSSWSDANAAIPSIEERLVSLERGMGEMIHLMRQMVNNSPRDCPSRHGSRNNSIDEAAANNNAPAPHVTLKPVQFIRDLQVECFGERDQFSTETELLGDVVSQGIVDAKLSLKLIELFVDYFSQWVSIDHATNIQRTNPLLFNTACLLASRYLPGMPPNTIHEIALQVQLAVTKTLWRKAPLTDDLLQALALLCLYPTSGHKEGFMDAWLLSGIAINHALSSFGFLNNSPHKNIPSDEMLPQMRLWNTFCLTHLHSALGYGRNVNVLSQYFDHCPLILEHPRATQDDGRIVAEIQLYRIALKIRNNTQRLQFTETEYEEIERWKMEWSHLLCKLPRPSVQAEFIILTHPCSQRRPIHPRTQHLVLPTPPSTHRIPSSTRVRPTRHRDLQQRPPHHLAVHADPILRRPGLIDHVYYILGYAALTLCDYTPSDPVIDQVRAFLLHLAPSSDHLSYRIAYIIGEVQRRYAEPTSATQSSPTSVGLKNANAMFAAPAAARSESLDLTALMPSGGSMDGLVENYGCFEQLMPGYVAPQPAFSAPTVFQHHTAPVMGGAMPVSLVPRALHDF